MIVGDRAGRPNLLGIDVATLASAHPRFSVSFQVLGIHMITLLQSPL
jgi:hypothetical protein